MQIKIDGHVFENNYIASNALEVKVAQDTICIKCNYKINNIISVLKEDIVNNIIMRDDYLICEEYQIKNILE